MPELGSIPINKYSVSPQLEVAQNQRFLRLPRSLSALETWGFGLTGNLIWIGAAPAMHAALGTAAIFIWIPAIIASVMLNLQLKRLGQHWPDISGGSPNYTVKLLEKYPFWGRYAAAGYVLSWIAYLPINVFILTALVKTNLAALGITCPEALLNLGFTLITYVVAFNGTRALGILHSFFVIPAVGFLLVFCFQGLGWLTFSPTSPGLLPSHWSSISAIDWTKWYLFAIYSACSCDTASSFVADSRRPYTTLQCLSFAAWLIPPVYLGGSWVLMQLATAQGLGEDTYLNLLAAASPFWGNWASFLVTLLIAASSLMGCATAVSNSPRILYQLAQDGHIAPVFAIISRQGALVPSLIFCLFVSLLSLMWGDLTRIIVITATNYVVALTTFHFGLWLGRGRPEVRWPWWSLGFFLIEVIVLIFCFWAWPWQDVLIGLLSPLGLLFLAANIRRIKFAPFHRRWWLHIYRQRTTTRVKDFVAFQVITLLILVSGAATVAWYIRDKFENISASASNNLLVILLMSIAFIAIAIACWTSLPQVTAIDEAREQAENLFITALDTVPDTILVVDEQGIITQANPAAKSLFHSQNQELVGHQLQEFFSHLTSSPDTWPHISEQIFISASTNSQRIIEATISQRYNRHIFEYIVILRDITERKIAEQALQDSEAQSRQQALQLQATLQQLQQTQAQLIQTEKMSSLGQLVAGVAHEINNPVNFIYGNINHVHDYAQDLLSLVNLCQQRSLLKDPEIQEHIQEIDLEFLSEDLPKTLSSMKMGAERIRQIVLTLRNFSRLDESDMKPVNLHEGIDSTLVILHNRIKAKTDRPAVEIFREYGELPLVECYAGQLNQVFMNILNNSIDALFELLDKDLNFSNPSITIYTQKLDSNWVRVGIKDNALGMSAETKSKIFDPFFTTKPVGKGTGLGLSISYQIVADKHQGRLECLSELGQGTEFIIDIPIKQIIKTTVIGEQEVLA